MLHSAQVEDLLVLVASLDRAALIEEFHNYRGRFEVDFTDDFLTTTPLDKLRHIFVAMCMQNERLPDHMPHAA
jgi:hypothetical protein